MSTISDILASSSRDDTCKACANPLSMHRLEGNHCPDRHGWERKKTFVRKKKVPVSDLAHDLVAELIRAYLDDADFSELGEREREALKKKLDKLMKKHSRKGLRAKADSDYQISTDFPEQD